MTRDLARESGSDSGHAIPGAVSLFLEYGDNAGAVPIVTIFVQFLPFLCHDHEGPLLRFVTFFVGSFSGWVFVHLWHATFLFRLICVSVCVVCTKTSITYCLLLSL